MLATWSNQRLKFAKNAVRSVKSEARLSKEAGLLYALSAATEANSQARGRSLGSGIREYEQLTFQSENAGYHSAPPSVFAIPP